MKILTVISELPPVRSGVATAGKRLIEGYRQRGHDADAITMRSLPKLVWRELRLSFFFLRWPSLRRRLADYDAVHIHGPAPTFSELFLVLLRLTMRGTNRPKVVYTHHFELELPRLRLLCALYNRLHSQILRLADEVVVTTAAYERLLAGRGLGRVSVVPWGADDRRYPAVRRQSEPFEILCVGQARPYKGIEILLRAARELPDADVHIVGDGHGRQEYEKLAARLFLPRVRFHGELPDAALATRFAKSHVIVLPSVSRMEAFGMTLLEGMMAGCVPVASDLPGVADVVADAGLLVPPGDGGQLAAALRRLWQDEALRDALSARARRRAAAFRWTATIGDYVALFERPSGYRSAGLREHDAVA